MNWLSAAVVLMGIGAAGAAPDPVLPVCAKQVTDFSNFVRAEYTNGVPFTVARSFSQCPWAVSAADDLLNPTNGSAPPFAENIVFTLGIMGKIEAIPGLIKFLENPDPVQENALSYSSYLAKVNVPVALGCILNQIDLDLNSKVDQPINVAPVSRLREAQKEILTYLINGLIDSRQWQERIKWKSSYDASDLDRDVYLVKKTVQGLGLSGDITAGCLLNWSKDHLETSHKEALRSVGECGFEVGSNGRHWGQESIKKSDLVQLGRLLRDAIDTNAQVRSCSRGLLDYYGGSFSCTPHRK